MVAAEACGSSSMMNPELKTPTDTLKTFRHFPRYGSISGSSAGDACPTCRGTGRIPRGQEDQLVAVIPCNDVRLKPRRTKLYVCVSIAMCLFLCCLILFFFFPRSVTLTPVSVLSVQVFIKDTVNMTVTNLINITNENFVPVQIAEFTMQGLVTKMVMGTTRITNMTSLQPRSQKSYTIKLDLLLKDPGLVSYCKSTSINIHTLFLELQMTMNISYLSHMEQLSLNTFEYIDCGTNSTIPHPVRR